MSKDSNNELNKLERAERLWQMKVWPHFNSFENSNKSTIDFALVVIKSGMYLNGGALVILPTIMTLLGIGTVSEKYKLVITFSLFSGGVLLSWLAAVFGYFALDYYGRMHQENANKEAMELNKFLIKCYNLPDANYKSNEDEINEAISKYNTLRICGVVTCIISIFCFILGTVLSIITSINL